MTSSTEVIVDNIIEKLIDDQHGNLSAFAAENLRLNLIEAFGWHPIERADEFGVRIVPDGKHWGPRVVVMTHAGMMIAYWDPDLIQSDGSPVAAPAPYWRSIGMTAGWSRKHQPTHFLRRHLPL